MSEDGDPPDGGTSRSREVKELLVAASTDRNNLGYAIARFLLEGRPVTLVGMGDAVLATMMQSVIKAQGFLGQYARSLKVSPFLREKADPQNAENMITEILLCVREEVPRGQ